VGDLYPIYYAVPWVHPTQQPKRHLDQFSRFCTDDRKMSLSKLRSKLPLPMVGDVDPTEYMVPWAHPSPQQKRHLDRFSRFCRVH